MTAYLKLCDKDENIEKDIGFLANKLNIKKPFVYLQFRYDNGSSAVSE